MNRDDDSRNDHRNEMGIRMGCRFTLRTVKMWQTQHHLLRKCLHLPKTLVLHRQFKGVHKRVSGPSVDARHAMNGDGIAERDVRRAKKKEQPQRWFKAAFPMNGGHCAMECSCYLRNVHDKMAPSKRAYEKPLRCNICRTIDPVRSSTKLQTLLS